MRELRHYILTALAVAALVVAGLSCMAPMTALADPSVETAGKQTPSTPNQDEAQDVIDSATPEQQTALLKYLEKLDEIDRNTEMATEQYNTSKVRLDNISGDIEQRKIDLEALSKAYKIQSDRLNNRAVLLYKNGEMGLVALLFDSSSVADFFTRMDYIAQLSAADGDLLGAISNERDTIQNSLAQLVLDKQEASSLEFELKARKIEIEARNNEKKDRLDSKNKDIIDLLATLRAAEAAVEQGFVNVISAGVEPTVSIAKGSPSETAMAYRGIPYVWGGESKSGMDCSGLVTYVFRQHDVELPHSSEVQSTIGEPISSKAKLQPNDVVFFGNPVHHCGIYLGGDFFIHAPMSGDVIKVSLLSSRNDFVGGRRYDWQPRTGKIK